MNAEISFKYAVCKPLSALSGLTVATAMAIMIRVLPNDKRVE